MATLNDGRISVDVSANKTLTAADAGIVQNVITDAVVVTLPATADGLSFTVRNGGDNASGTPTGAGADGSALVSVAPVAADGITGNGFTAAVNKAALNTKTTSKVGDEITLLGNGTTGVTAWTVNGVKGTWARAAQLINKRGYSTDSVVHKNQNATVYTPSTFKYHG